MIYISCSVHLISTYYACKGSWTFYLNYPQINEVGKSNHMETTEHQGDWSLVSHPQPSPPQNATRVLDLRTHANWMNPSLLSLSFILIGCSNKWCHSVYQADLVTVIWGQTAVFWQSFCLLLWDVCFRLFPALLRMSMSWRQRHTRLWGEPGMKSRIHFFYIIQNYSFIHSFIHSLRWSPIQVLTPPDQA